MKTLVLSLGGSIIMPDKINISFLKNFRKLILAFVKKGYRFVIVTGGGEVNREYNKAAKDITRVGDKDLDYIGIAATRMNAELIRAIFSEQAFEKVVFDPTKPVRTNKKIIVGAGFKPGCSSDKDAVLLAKQFGAKEMVNLFDKDYVYTDDPDKNKKAMPLKKMLWKDFIKLLGPYKPRGSWPFDPEASKLASKSEIRLVAMSGTNLANLKKYLEGKPFKGTVIF